MAIPVGNTVTLTTSSQADVGDLLSTAQQSAGKLGRYQVVLNCKNDSSLPSSGELGVYAEVGKVSIFERIINYFTGALTQEKNEAMIDFIGTGTIKILEEDEEGSALLTDLESLTPEAGFGNQLRVFREVMNGSTKATPDQKDKAVDALIRFIEGQDHAETKASLIKKAQVYVAKHGIEHKVLQEALIGDTSVGYATVEAAKPLVNEGLSQEVEGDEFFDIDLNS